MSNVTNVLLTVSPGGELQVEQKLKAWAEAEECPPFRRVNIHAGGDKNMEVTVWAGAFNYMSVIRLMTDLCGEWKYPELVTDLQLLVKGQHDTHFQIYNLLDGGWHQAS